MLCCAPLAAVFHDGSCCCAVVRMVCACCVKCSLVDWACAARRGIVWMRSMAAHSDRSLRIRRAVGQQAASCRLVNSPWPSGGGGAAVSESVWALRHGRLSVSSVCAGGDEGGDNRTVRPPVPASQPRYRPHAPGSGSASVLVSELCMYACLHACMSA
jgi:hypothetical protein